jgi:hypothetical protein
MGVLAPAHGGVSVVFGSLRAAFEAKFPMTYVISNLVEIYIRSLSKSIL